MDDVYSLKIEVDVPGQLELIDLILEVEHNVVSDGWELQMDYNEEFGELPIFYISNFLDILRGKYKDLEKIGICREMISIWRCIVGPQEVFMEYWPEEMHLMAVEGIRFRILCRVPQEDDDEPPHFGRFPVLN